MSMGFIIESGLDIEGFPLRPGGLYCLGSYGPGGDKDYGSLAWYGSDGKFYNADYPDTEGQEITWKYDFAVYQDGSAINQDYIFEEGS